MEATIVVRQDVMEKFQEILAETELDHSGLLEFLINLYHSYVKSCAKKGRPFRKILKIGNSRKFEATSDAPIRGRHHNSSRTLPKRRGVKANKLQEKLTKAADTTPPQANVVMPDTDISALGKDPSEPEQDRSNVLTTNALFGNLTPARRSLRKPKSPKRKVLESKLDSTQTEASGVKSETPPTPKRRRKNKPQKVVQPSSENNSCSESDEENSEVSNTVDSKQPTGNKERKSKVNAKSVIDEMVKDILTGEGAIPEDSNSGDAAVGDGEKGSNSDTSDSQEKIVEEENLTAKVQSAVDKETQMSAPRKVGRPKGSVKGVKSERKSFKCNLCQASFQRPAHLKRHVEGVHSKPSEFSCRGCGKSLTSDLTRKYHESFACKLLRLPYECKDCHIRFDTEQEVTDHKCSKDPTKPCVCPTCDYKTASPRDLEQHLRVHTGEKCFKCDQCDFATAWRKNLKEHMFKHTGLKPYVCDICDFATNDRHNLRSHRTTHSSEKAYMCEICGDKFREPRFLKTHQIVHTDLKPYKCELCNYAAKFKSCLRSHMLYHTGVKKFVCEQCGQSFRTKNHLQTHLNSVHLYPDMMYGCKHCNYTASNSQSINSHMRKHTKKPKKGKSPKKKHVPGEESISELDSLNLDARKQKKQVNIFRFEASHQESSQVLTSSSVHSLHTDLKHLEPNPLNTINPQDLQELREGHSDLTQLPIPPGDVLTVLPCFNNDTPTLAATTTSPQQESTGVVLGSDITRPQYEELLYNSNASQAETISAMMNLIREFRPR